MAASPDSGRLPLSALLSQALVAFTIELDNTFEQRMDVWSTDFGGKRPDGVWTTSLRQWSNFMRLVDPDGVTVAELERRARAAPALDGMRRWGYVKLEADPRDERRKVPERELIIRPKRGGERAAEVWRPLPGEIEARWCKRFGAARLTALRDALQRLVAALALPLPEYLTAHYGGFVMPPVDNGDPLTPPELLPISALLSQPLQAFALQYEAGIKPSLCFTANILRVLDADGVRPRDVPARSGVALPALKTALGILAKARFIEMRPDPNASRGQVAALTELGEAARAVYPGRCQAVESDWRERFGDEAVDPVRRGLEAIVVGDGERSPLFAGLAPPEGTWRSKVKPLPVLPDFPMPRQGGHPDGV